MTTSLLSRRRFLQATTAAGFAAWIARDTALAAPTPAPWTIGCLNRPWVKWSADEMLDGIRAAGYTTIGLQTTTPKDKWVGNNSRDYLVALKEKIARRGLTAFQGRLTTKDGTPFDTAAGEIRQQIDHAKFLGLSCLINTGTAKPQFYEGWYRMMNYAAKYGADAGVQIVTKPHGGVIADAADLRKCLEKVNHPNLTLWYDAGNVIYYTGKDPLQELEPIIDHVTAFTAKDCAGKGADVMTQFGTGAVDFVALFRRLKKAGFKGPIVVVSCAVGATADETTKNATANRKFLEAALAKV
jgi:sugar phosphate isomerase/epimerase